MSLKRAAMFAVVVAAAVVGAGMSAMSVPLHWALLVALPAAVLTLAGCLLAGTFDADWTAEPDPPAASVTLHATFLTERLERSTIDQYRFTSRVQPRLRRIAQSVLGQDLDTPVARERLGTDLHRLLTARDAQLPPPKTFAALMRRLEEL
ncbi:hypothetical protein [Actinophytocola glycyrrhizae]|uniref:Uncharacterized protein n=1 Tax=Actinophytocola glycyrrhizae TaxID=2044873 RepID=A0ABV9RXE6_9PSEU